MKYDMGESLRQPNKKENATVQMADEVCNTEDYQFIVLNVK